MIQRIQTLFLFLAFAAGIGDFFFPLANFFSDEYSIQFTLLGTRKFTEYSSDVDVNTIPLIVINLLYSLGAFTTIFIYKRRIVQLRLTRFAIFLNVIYLALIFFFYVPQLETVTGVSADYFTQPGIYLPLVSLVMLVLANRFILRDIKLVRSADRLR